MNDLSRRDFLALVAGGATALVASCGRSRVGITAADLQAVLAHGAYTEMVGRQYLRKVPEEADVNRLGELILSDLSRTASNGDIRARVREQVRRDFSEDRVVRLGQWILSQTEARLCALTALSHDTEPTS